MYRPRVIPILLLQNKGLVKSEQFAKHRYIGDPINAVRIFNDLQADELVFLDILASKENRTISLDFVRKVGEEANMPFAVGGGITTIQQIQDVLAAGAEKVVLNSIALLNPSFVREAADTFGSSTVCVCIDVKKDFLGRLRVWSHAGSKKQSYMPVDFAKLMEQQGAGELIIQSIEKDGTMSGYDLTLVESIATAVTIPVVAAGGAGKLSDFKSAVEKGYASAVAAGSLFVYHGPRKGILINYPDKKTLIDIFK
jgi:cyclase